MLLESIFSGLINFIGPIIAFILNSLMILVGVSLSIFITIIIPLYIIYLILDKIGIVTQFNRYKMKKKGLIVTFTFNTVYLLLNNPDYTWDFKNCIVTTIEGPEIIDNLLYLKDDSEISNYFYMSLKDKRKINKVLNDIACQKEESKSLEYKKKLLVQNLALVKKLEKDIKRDSEHIDSELAENYRKYTDRLNNLTLTQ